MTRPESDKHGRPIEGSYEQYRTRPESEERQVIRPRTKDERMALLTGYAMAVEDANKHGLKFAADQLRLLKETEDGLSR